MCIEFVKWVSIALRIFSLVTTCTVFGAAALAASTSFLSRSLKKRRPRLTLRLPSREDAVQEVPTGREYGSGTPSCGTESGACTPLDDPTSMPSLNCKPNDEGWVRIVWRLCVRTFKSVPLVNAFLQFCFYPRTESACVEVFTYFCDLLFWLS